MTTPALDTPGPQTREQATYRHQNSQQFSAGPAATNADGAEQAGITDAELAMMRATAAGFAASQGLPLDIKQLHILTEPAHTDGASAGTSRCFYTKQLSKHMMGMLQEPTEYRHDD